MEQIKAIQGLVDIMRNLKDGLVNFSEAKRLAYGVFQNIEIVLDENKFNFGFPVLAKYFFDPAKKVKTIIQEKEISMANLLIGHKFIRESKLAKMMFLSNRYPRSLLARSAMNLLWFMKHNSQYLPKIMRGEMVSPMMLEIHPTNAMCIYRCKMCIWCGGEKQKNPIWVSMEQNSYLLRISGVKFWRKQKVWVPIK
jgi:hypothetical protein